MYSIPSALRGQANAVSIFFAHLFGDFPSPYIIGVLIEDMGDQYAMMILLGWLIFSFIFWLFALCKAKSRYGNESHLQLIEPSKKIITNK